VLPSSTSAFSRPTIASVMLTPAMFAHILFRPPHLDIPDSWQEFVKFNYLQQMIVAHHDFLARILVEVSSGIYTSRHHLQQHWETHLQTANEIRLGIRKVQ
jgi:hypothetical protein